MDKAAEKEKRCKRKEPPGSACTPLSSLLRVPVAPRTCVQSLRGFQAALCSEVGASRSQRGRKTPRGRARGRERGRGTAIARKGTRRKKIWSSESSKLSPVWCWAVKRPLQMNLAAGFPAFCRQHVPPVGSPPPLTLCSALAACKRRSASSAVQRAMDPASAGARNG